MYKILEVSIDGFWQKYNATSKFKEDVNIVIGDNGSGKTTFMNILHAVLAVDPEALFLNDFTAVVIKLSNGKSSKQIKAIKIENDKSTYPIIEYQISTKKFLFQIGDEQSLPFSLRRRMQDELKRTKDELSKLVSLASLSVYRIASESDLEMRDRSSKRSLSPVDMRLNNLMQRLTHFQLELSLKVRDVSSQLQKDVLVSLLYEKKTNETEQAYGIDFDEAAERSSLLTAYKQLGLTGSDITKRILDHTLAISEATKKLQNILSSSRIENTDDNEEELNLDFSPLEAKKRTSRVIEKSLDAEVKIKDILSQIDKFLSTLKEFIPEKSFSFKNGVLVVENNSDISVSKLSSGEKQLLILLIETLLQKQQPYIFLADEPELSLHISWQRKIISSIINLNPYAQIIVATHSPEIAGKYKNRILDMGSILSV